MTSARESSSRPKSLLVLVMRAMRPSSPSNNTANSHLQSSCWIQQHVYSRAEFNHTDALTTRDPVTNFLGEDNAPRQQSGNLLKNNVPIPFHSHHVLLIMLGADRVHGV